MRRREFLLGAGTVATGGAGWYATRGPRETLQVRVWCTEGAASYRGLTDRIEGYLRGGLGPVCERLELSVGGTVPVGAEHGRALMAYEWPLLVGQGAVGLGSVDPVRDVNLLVTDGNPRRRPAGYGLAHVATVTGARHLAGAPARESVGDHVADGPTGAVTQLLLHETGHALGLGHDHGTVTLEGNAAIASPMIGSYAWRGSDAAGSDGRFSRGSDPARRLGLTYSPAARKKIQSYRGGIVP